MAHEPLVTTVIIKQLGARQIKPTPPCRPHGRRCRTVAAQPSVTRKRTEQAAGAWHSRFLKHGPHDRHVVVLLLQPRVARAPIVPPVHHPRRLEHQVLLEALEQRVAGHGAAGEEVAAHPVVRALSFKVVGSARVGEYVDEEEAVRLQKLRHFLQQQLVVLHVLHHLNRHDAVECAAVLVVQLHGCNVARLDGDVGQAVLGGTRFDVNLLGGRVGNHEEGAVRQLLRGEDGEGAPAAAEVQDPEASGARWYLSAFEIEQKHALLGGLMGVRCKRGIELATRVVTCLRMRGALPAALDPCRPQAECRALPG